MKLKKVEPVGPDRGQYGGQSPRVTIYKTGMFAFTKSAVQITGLKEGKCFELYMDDEEKTYFILVGSGSHVARTDKKGHIVFQSSGMAKAILGGEKKKVFLVAGKPTAHGGKVYYALIPKPVV